MTRSYSANEEEEYEALLASHTESCTPDFPCELCEENKE